MAVGDLLAWWNLVFLLPGAAGLCLAFLSTVGGQGDEASPLGLLLTVLLTTYGAIGLAANRIHSSMPALLPLSLAVAAAGSLLVSALVLRVLSQVAPGDETYPSSFESLVGCSGTVVSLLPASEGHAQVQDHRGAVQTVRCKDLSSTPLLPGERVVVARVDSDERLCLVVKVAEASVPDGEVGQRMRST
jgi:membrane protein implicated in regulation of membrane protease activity